MRRYLSEIISSSEFCVIDTSVLTHPFDNICREMFDIRSYDNISMEKIDDMRRALNYMDEIQKIKNLYVVEGTCDEILSLNEIFSSKLKYLNTNQFFERKKDFKKQKFKIKTKRKLSISKRIEGYWKLNQNNFGRDEQKREALEEISYEILQFSKKLRNENVYRIPKDVYNAFLKLAEVQNKRIEKIEWKFKYTPRVSRILSKPKNLADIEIVATALSLPLFGISPDIVTADSDIHNMLRYSYAFLVWKTEAPHAKFFTEIYRKYPIVCWFVNPAKRDRTDLNEIETILEFDSSEDREFDRAQYKLWYPKKLKKELKKEMHIVYRVANENHWDRSCRKSEKSNRDIYPEQKEETYYTLYEQGDFEFGQRGKT
ncbi:MAG: hypothetical protein QXG26_00605 [Candidatus Aenigmatarchaeota archaeon]